MASIFDASIPFFTMCCFMPALIVMMCTARRYTNISSLRPRAIDSARERRRYPDADVEIPKLIER